MRARGDMSDSDDSDSDSDDVSDVSSVHTSDLSLSDDDVPLGVPPKSSETKFVTLVHERARTATYTALTLLRTTMRTRTCPVCVCVSMRESA